MFKIISEKTEVIEDTDPRLYAKRFERALKNKEYSQALIEIDKAIKYETNCGHKIQYMKYKIDALYGIKNEEKLFDYISSELSFFMNNIKVYDIINLIQSNIKKEKNRIALFKDIINLSNDDYSVIKKIMSITDIKNRSFIYEYLKETIINKSYEEDIEWVLNYISKINIDENYKASLLLNLHEHYKYDISILVDLAKIGKKEEQKKYIKDNLIKIIEFSGLENFILKLKHSNFNCSYKINLLKRAIKKYKDNLILLDEIIEYYKDDLEGAIEYIDYLLDEIYTNYNELSLIYLRKGVLLYKLNRLKESKYILKRALKLSKNETIRENQKGEILYNLSLVYFALGKKDFRYINYKIAMKMYKKATKNGYIIKIPKELEESYNRYFYGIRWLIIYIIIIGSLIFITYNRNENSDSSNESCNYLEEENYQDEEIERSAEETNKIDKEISFVNFLDENLYNNSNIFYSVYTNTYENESDAQKELTMLYSKGIKCKIVQVDNDYKVMVGNSDTIEGAKNIKSKLKNELDDELYILATDKDVDEKLCEAQSYISYDNIELAKEKLIYVDNYINKEGYERYKKKYDELKKYLQSHKVYSDIEISEITDLLDSIVYNYSVAIREGNPEMMYEYVTYKGEEYKDYEKNIPNLYKKNIEVNTLDYKITNMSVEQNGSYRVNIIISFEIKNPDGVRYQKEQMDYIIIKDPLSDKLLVDRCENWKIVHN